MNISLSDIKLLLSDIKLLLSVYPFQHARYSRVLDKWVNKQFDTKNAKIELGDSYFAKFNGHNIWIANFPYALEFTNLKYRPSKYNCYRIYKEFLKVREEFIMRSLDK